MDHRPAKDHESLRQRGYPRPQIGLDPTAKQEVEKGTLTKDVLPDQLFDQVEPHRTSRANKPSNNNATTLHDDDDIIVIIHADDRLEPSSKV